MKINKNKTIWRAVLGALLTLLLGCAVSGYSLFGNKSADALSSVPTTTSVQDPLYDFEKYCYSEDMLNQLAKLLLTNPSADINTLITYAKNTAGVTGQPISNKNITLKYGRYKFGAKNAYQDMVWLPVYLSRTNDTQGDAVLTLYLAATSEGMAVSQQEKGYYTQDGTYSTVYNAIPPSYSYGSSHLRAVSLGNGGKYSYYSRTDLTSGSMTNAKIEEANYNKFSDFAKEDNSNPKTVTFSGLLNEDVVTPSKMKWQANESAVASLQGTTYGQYNWPNDSYDIPSTGNVYLPDYFGTTVTMTNPYYNIWQNDNVWIPSITEVGTGDKDGDGAGSLNGIWQLNNSQRSNTRMSWLRSAATTANKTTSGSNSYSAYTMYCTATNGTITTCDLKNAGAYMGTECAIRPAIHLNLSKIKDKCTPPVNLPDMSKGGFVKTVYNGEVHEISTDKCTLTPEEIPWYVNDGTMIVNFFAWDDEELMNGAIAPINAGSYRMLVQLRGGKQFIDGSTSKVTKFVIEKAKIGVEWQYDDDKVPSIKNIVGTFYEIDKINGSIPEISLKYRHTGGAGTYYTYPDKKGYYVATAYIVDEDKNNYNYEVAEVNKVSITSSQFWVKQKAIEMPYFLEQGENAGLKITRSYKGRQYIEIANISDYLEISVTTYNGTSDADKVMAQKALESIKQIGITSAGVAVYEVKDVSTYTFTIKIKDPINIMWPTGTEQNPDVQDVTLTLALDRADITVDFEGLTNSWETNRQMTFTLAISGIQADAEEQVMRVYYLTPTGSQVTLTPDASGTYTIKSGLNIGVYTLVASLAGAGQTSGNYQMKSAKSQRFEILQTVANFNSSLVRWGYKIGTSPALTPLNEIGTGNTQSSPIVLGFADDFYQFTLTASESSLYNYSVRAIYTGYIYSDEDKAYVEYDGAKYVRDAGSYRISVKITAYDKNVIFTDQEYNCYFTIKKKTYDLSDVKWDYSSAYSYSGEEQKVLLKADTLPAGLTTNYIGNTATGAGNYSATVRFLVAGDYAANYEVPVKNVSSSYTGSFSFDLEWGIVPQEIELNWTDNSSSDLLFVPTLVEGGSFVDYTFEHQVGGSWTACNSVEPAATVTEKYRVTAKLKSAYSNNYTLKGTDNPHEFDVQSGKTPVTIHYELNNVRVENGGEVTYTGLPYNATVVSDVAGTNVSSTVTYYSANDSGTKLNPLSSAPVIAGNYVAVFSVTLDGAYITNNDATEVFFKIVKADIDISELHWEITHGFTVISAYFDADSLKWVDEDGREVIMEFEYDGTPYSFAFIGAVSGLTIGNVLGNTGTAVNGYDTVVSLDWDRDNYNEPVIPASVHWEITKATIHFENVKWGYIDKEGNEHEFDFDNDTFLFTRDNDGVVEYKVGLINLPAGFQSLMDYKTICLTEVSATKKPGNSATDIGRYRTTLELAGTFTDPNYESFNTMNFPSSIPMFLEWEIAKRPLTKINYNKSWGTFDNRTHNLIELIGIPEEELCYYEIEITFLDTANGVYNYYEGYEGVEYTGFHAGTYTVRLYELVGKEEKPFFWDSVDIEVKQLGLEVTWDDKGAYPVARVTGVYVSDMIGTRYTLVLDGEEGDDSVGGEVTLNYVLASQGAQDFWAIPYVTEAYSKNMGIKMKAGERDKIKFRYSPYTPTGSSKAIKKEDIYFIADTQEYTGENVLFSLAFWDSYKDCLYYEGDSLTQKEVGTYHITVSFIKYDPLTGEGDAYWAGTSGERDSITLEFKIIPRTNIPLEYPKFNMYSANYTGKEIEFVITNWIVLQDYINFKVTFNGRDLGTQLTHVTAGVYTVTFNFNEGSIGYWANDPANPKKEYKVQFEIVPPGGGTAARTLLDPQLERGGTVASMALYTGVPIEFSIANWDSYYSQYVDVVGNLTNTNVGTYTVTLAVKQGVNAVFSTGEKEYSLSYTIIPEDKIDAEIPLQRPAFVSNSKNLTSAGVSFEIANWNDIYSIFLEMSGDSLTQTEKGTYKVKLSFKQGTKAYWSDSNTREDVELTFYVLDPNGGGTTPGEPVRINPNEVFIVLDAKEYTGREIQFDINNWEYLRDYITIDGGRDYLNLLKTEVGEYTISVQIKNPSAATWTGGSIEPITLKFRIKQATLTLGEKDEDGNERLIDEEGKIIAINGDGERVDADLFLNYLYRDEEGNVVPADEMEDGKNYYVTVRLKDDMAEDFDICFTNGAENFKQNLDSKINSENGGKGLEFTKSPKQGLSTILVITIAIVSVLLVLVLATVIVLIIKRRQYAEEPDVEYVYDDEDDDEDY